MNKKFFTQPMNIICAIFCLSIIISFASQFVCIASISDWKGLLVSAGLCVLGIIFYFLGKSHPVLRILNPVCNAIGIGFATATFYIVTDVVLSIESSVAVICGAVALIIIVCVVLNLLPYHKSILLVAIALCLLGIVLAVINWRNDRSLFSQLFFFSIFSASLLFGLFGFVVTRTDIWRCLSVAYFAALTIIIFVVLVIITEGDALDIGDLSIDAGGERKNKKTPSDTGNLL